VKRGPKPGRKNWVDRELETSVIGQMQQVELQRQRSNLLAGTLLRPSDLPINRRSRRVRPAEVDDLPWNKPGLNRANKVITFCESLKVTSGTDTGKTLVLREWQREFINRIYAENTAGIRPVRTAILSMARKNGKTQLAAALALCHLCGPEQEERGEVYSCANDRFQAAKIYSEMSAMIERQPLLAYRLVTNRIHKTIEDLETGSMYVALSRDARTKMGLSPSFVVYDELGQTGDRALYDAMDSAMGARKNPLMLVISTQAANDLAPMSRLIDYGLRVNSGDVVDPAFHLTLHCAPLEADPWSLETWKLANPALDDFRSLEDVERLAQQAQRMPTQESAFRNLILNQRVAAETRFIERSEWAACAEPPNIPLGASCWAALDLGATRDLSALVLIYEDSERKFHVLPHFWLPGDIRARSQEDKVPYDVWVRDELITPIGASTDPAVIAAKIAELTGRYTIEALAFDRWRIADLQRELNNIGCTVPLAPHGQGFKDMSPAVTALESMVVEGRLRHGGHPVLTWNAFNAVVTRDPAGNRKLDKAKSIGRIDGLVALAMAFSLLRGEQAKPFDVMAMIG
jgi:phage terminase large subunit-like protein